jgi:CRISPR/Cas system-associated protein Cas7 (RAMP superfamily)
MGNSMFNINLALQLLKDPIIYSANGKNNIETNSAKYENKIKTTNDKFPIMLIIFDESFKNEKEIITKAIKEQKNEDSSMNILLENIKELQI